ncbi:TetR/AcrR family transcriptional regulator [Seonamhaeicola marinus]|uniref:TetR/AcrR family transcriptional regulator n=1 Tax=Seonamhaeicola marinus TaxID=1912246 RepID=A0A5D0HK10_9FLAO|nr:TetR/AcrR family transcriptional regulator [Seonamhaeicola marinus]TYA71628.1 TetR/AcrR family transcriptional regulator [Seonamhaeicola marinus]
MDKRHLLLEAATKLFVERGLHGTPTSAISKEAGVSAGILFHYFKTKDDLIDELYVSLKKEYTGYILQDIDRVKSDLGRLRLIWSNSWNWALDNSLKFRFLMQLDTTSASERVKSHPEIIAKYEMFGTFIQEYIDKALIRNADLAFLMGSMMGLITSMVTYLNQFPDKRQDHVFIEQAWEMYYSYIKP